MESTSQKTVVIAGAGGFVGTALAQRLRDTCRVIGLSRSLKRGREQGNPDSPVDVWRQGDLYSLLDAEEAMVGADVGVYLVHSMMPTGLMTQATFRDLDLLLADNFARAARRKGVRRIVYLGGIIPDADHLSDHLASRLEVEAALAQYGAEVITLRASLILGRSGSSSRILYALVDRLPAMVLPSWTQTLTEPIALNDVADLLAFAALSPDVAPGAYDVGGGEVVTYQQLMERLAAVMDKKPPMVPVPLLTPRLSRLWISATTGAPRALVDPLIGSLAHEMVADDARLREQAGLRPTPLDEGLREVLIGGRERAQPSAFRGSPTKALREVRSVQRLPLPPGRNAFWVAEEYLRFLPRFFGGIFRVEVDGDEARFYLRLIPKPLLVLELSRTRSIPERPLFYITGGLLARDARRDRLEFREVMGGRALLAAIHEFQPSLWWPLYRATQAPFHAHVMASFGHHLARVPALTEAARGRDPYQRKALFDESRRAG